MDINQIITDLRNFSTPELCDGMDNPKVLPYEIMRKVTNHKIVGPAFTVEVPDGVSGIIPEAIAACKKGDVLVIAGKGNCSKSYWGDFRSFCAKSREIEGVVIDGAFRDIDGCENEGIPIFARAIVPRSAEKAAVGKLNVPIICGDVEIHPGDLIVGDENGVIVFSPENAKDIMERSKKKIEAETERRLQWQQHMGTK